MGTKTVVECDAMGHIGERQLETTVDLNGNPVLAPYYSVQVGKETHMICGVCAATPAKVEGFAQPVRDQLDQSIDAGIRQLLANQATFERLKATEPVPLGGAK